MVQVDALATNFTKLTLQNVSKPYDKKLLDKIATFTENYDLWRREDLSLLTIYLALCGTCNEQGLFDFPIATV